MISDTYIWYGICNRIQYQPTARRNQMSTFSKNKSVSQVSTVVIVVILLGFGYMLTNVLKGIPSQSEVSKTLN